MLPCSLGLLAGRSKEETDRWCINWFPDATGKFENLTVETTIVHQEWIISVNLESRHDLLELEEERTWLLVLPASVSGVYRFNRVMC